MYLAATGSLTRRCCQGIHWRFAYDGSLWLSPDATDNSGNLLLHALLDVVFDLIDPKSPIDQHINSNHCLQTFRLPRDSKNNVLPDASLNASRNANANSLIPKFLPGSAPSCPFSNMEYRMNNILLSC